MKIIGITGKSGSGKTTLTAKLAEEIKCNSIDIDKIGHQSTENEQISKKLCEIFGFEILGKTGKIDRKKLGNIVFANKEKMKILTDMTWDFMQEKLDEILKNEKGNTIILEWALLPISKYWEQIDLKILMTAEYNQRKDKVIKRDKIDEEYFVKRESDSLNYENYEFDYMFSNDYNFETIGKIVNKLRCNTKIE